MQQPSVNQNQGVCRAALSRQPLVAGLGTDLERRSHLWLEGVQRSVHGIRCQGPHRQDVLPAALEPLLDHLVRLRDHLVHRLVDDLVEQLRHLLGQRQGDVEDGPPHVLRHRALDQVRDVLQPLRHELVEEGLDGVGDLERHAVEGPHAVLQRRVQDGLVDGGLGLALHQIRLLHHLRRCRLVSGVSGEWEEVCVGGAGVLESANPRMDSECASGCPWSTARGNSPSPGRPTPGVVKQDKSSGGSVDTTKTRSDPQRVGMSSWRQGRGAYMRVRGHWRGGHWLLLAPLGHALTLLAFGPLGLQA